MMRCRAALAGVLWLCGCGLDVSAQQRLSLAPADALARLASGHLAAAVVAGDLDLSGLSLAPGVAALHLRNVEVQGALIGPAAAPLWLEDVVMDEFIGADAVWYGAVDLRQVTIRRRMDCSNATLAAFSCRHPCRLGRYLDFSAASINGPFTLEAESPPRALASFVGTRFHGEARFTQTRFGDRTSFTLASFDQFTSFARVQSAGRLVFAGASFKQVVSFRDCRVEGLMFSLAPSLNSEAAPRFSPHASFAETGDFRRCRLGAMGLDDVSVGGRLDLRHAVFGAGGLSAFNVSAQDGAIDLRGAQWDGPLLLSSDELNQFQMTWPDLEPWLRFARASDEDSAADTDPIEQRFVEPRDYRNLARYLRAQGEAIPAQRAEYQQKALEWDQLRGGENDAAFVALEWLLWTWPTRNGTSLGRLLWLASLLLIFATGLLWFDRKRLVVVPLSTESSARDFRDCSISELPQGAFAPWLANDRLRLSAMSALRLAFFLTPGDYRYVSERHRLDLSAPVAARWFVWLAGKWLLALAAVTIANRSPALRAVLPFD